MSIFGIGVSGLSAAQAGLLTTSHNISNAATPGYSRQVIVQGTNSHLFTGAGFLGQGAHVETVRRVYDEFLGRQVLNAETGAAEMESYSAQISQIDNLMADPASGLSSALAAFFKGVQDVAANPMSVAARQSMLSAGQALTEIGDVSLETARLIERISAEVQQQAGTAGRVAAAMKDILAVTEQTSLGTRQTAVSIDQLTDLATELKGSVSGFKV